MSHEDEEIMEENYKLAMGLSMLTCTLWSYKSDYFHAKAITFLYISKNQMLPNEDANYAD